MKILEQFNKKVSCSTCKHLTLLRKLWPDPKLPVEDERFCAVQGKFKVISGGFTCPYWVERQGQEMDICYIDPRNKY